ncbi:MAG: hypothetical protein ISP94_01670 [SAR86 cluster bacterium]|jgi:hypothetical protein|uniref:Uncharacterized protein n=1 Tax=SAR86 cluster bacterium TaxID=2030880 RepID=A0A368BN07_9GAMM|nr:hypothetical protein [SAR86 cluster bacterium]MBL6819684.1 hypothetical protein [SAR86 cluster bacterium]OUW80830.1 MAG: hypothetical protein CBD79_01825 [Gammaproteobacteria bacterium TMED219]RCL38698.1 MAG: hypothetical protein DBW97_01415 [SAR86 cluster bacterium]
MKAVNDFVKGLTGVLVSVIGLGIVASIVFGGSTYFVGDVIATLMDYVAMLGENGLGGLIVLLIIMSVLGLK